MKNITEEKDIGPEILAYTDQPSKTIYISRRLYVDAYHGDSWSRFLLAHELGHAVLHSDYSDRTPHFAFEYKPTVTSVDESKVRGIPLFRDSERQADLFADFFLMPDRLVENCKSEYDLRQLANVDLWSANARLDFFGKEKAGKLPSYSSRPR